MSTSDAFHYRIKAAQRDLIDRAGGIARVVDLTSYSKSVVGRWNNGADSEEMPLGVVRILEADCKQPLITTIMAEVTGRRLTDPDEERLAETCMMQSLGDVMSHAAALTTSVAVAMSDGHVSPTEATTADRAAAKAEQSLSQFRMSLATIKARGGTAASLRVVGDD